MAHAHVLVFAAQVAQAAHQEALLVESGAQGVQAGDDQGEHDEETGR